MELFYINTLNYIRKKPILHKYIIYITKYTPYIPFVIYPIIIAYLFLIKHPLFIVTILKPSIAFIILTIFRKLVNRKRPYEIYNYEPLLSHKSGQSFPSRHTLSAVIIALVCYDIHMILGIVMLILAIIIALSRIIAGLHHISDVIVAIIFAFLIYTL